MKCNKLENEIIGEIDGIGRRFVSKGAEGVDVYEKGKMTHFDALPCQVVNTNGSGDALMAGIALAGPQASIEEAARIGLKLAMITAECPETVNKQLKQRYEELS